MNSPTVTLKEKLLIEASKLYLKYGVKSVSMDDIAKLMGISKKTIYNFISNKKDFVHAVVKAYLTDEEKRYDSITDNSSNAIDEIISIARRVQETLKDIKPTLIYDLKKYHPDTWQLIEKGHYSYIENSVAKNLERGIEEGFFRENLRIDILPKFYVTLARLVADIDVFKDKNIKQVELYESVILYHLNGILNKKGQKELSKYLKNEEI